MKLIESGYEDIHELINSFRESTDMAFILNQLRLGNTSYLNPADPMFGDFTEMPTSLADAQQRLIDAEYAFERLSPEIKQKFDNNFNVFIKSLGSELWFKNMGVGLDQVQDVKEEVSEDAES